MFDVLVITLSLFSLLNKANCYEICGNDSTVDCIENSKCFNLSRDFRDKLPPPAWMKRYPSVLEVFLKYNITRSVEIGIFKGHFSNHLLQNSDILQELHAVDPFLGDYDYKDASSNEIATHSQDWTNAVLNNMKQYGCRFRLHHNFSKNAITDFENESMDAVFIDAGHQYNDVVEDTKLWVPIVKPGGVIIWDDYSRYWRAVVVVVNQFVEQNNLTLIHLNSIGNVMAIKPLNRTLTYNFNAQ